MNFRNPRQQVSKLTKGEVKMSDEYYFGFFKGFFIGLLFTVVTTVLILKSNGVI
jgi:hypothetical protein